MAVTSLVDLDRAVVSRATDGTVTVDDPDSPVLVTVRVGQHRGRTVITQVTVAARHPSAQITGRALGRLPLAALTHVAAAMHAATPAEAYYRTLAAPRRPGQRSWDADHWERVLAVVEWARSTGRPGGPAQAVADMWAVTCSPTAYRWIRRARRWRDTHASPASGAPLAGDAS